MGRRSIKQDTKGTVTTNTTDFSKRSKFASSLREYVHKIKEFCYPVECTTTQYFHHFRRWKNAKQSYTFVESIPRIGKEVVITPEKKEEKEKEYENDLQRMLSLRKIKHQDPEQYRMGCMMLKWYFESKSRRNNHERINGDATGKLFNENEEQQKNASRHNHPTFKPASEIANTQAFTNNLKLSINKHGRIPRQTKFRPLDRCGRHSQEPFELEVENDKGTANERILDDLVHMIDDYLGDTN
ncbi:ZYRO0E04136p [Zygosaccharomyces rouxii]|uniref:ZYRO0E04136p n=2 Tax=Zygosaccharomyces rouxii TaxID=4956 RepID=C5E499_ZYGRC|nr:uncharacterized protein ZYRO0E04136g [Zygosaccharomyces rouxii]KAH9198283.1 hypothetical protein LQ764DRAFT_156592 [Zygosaccharomyces rouxii]CAQ43459.1 Zr_protein3 [Zygosaccharomyces rouxii]CAR30860.1 ZYRO0E04136p [Zygosaccharomyces rouxii]